MGLLEDLLYGPIISSGKSVKKLEKIIRNLKQVYIHIKSFKEKTRQLADIWGLVTEYRYTIVPTDVETKQFNEIKTGSVALTEILKYLKDKNPEKVNWKDYDLYFEARGKKKKRHLIIDIYKYPVKFEFKIKGKSQTAKI